MRRGWGWAVWYKRLVEAAGWVSAGCHVGGWCGRLMRAAGEGGYGRYLKGPGCEDLRLGYSLLTILTILTILTVLTVLTMLTMLTMLTIFAIFAIFTKQTMQTILAILTKLTY